MIQNKRKFSNRKIYFNVLCFIGTICFILSTFYIYSMHCHINKIEKELSSIEDDNAFNLSKRIQYRKLLTSIFNIDVKNAEQKEIYVNLSAYNAVVAQCDADPWYDSNGEPVMTGTVAISRDLEKDRIFHLNQFIFIPGHGVYKITGRMNKRYKRQIDILSGNEKAALIFGIRKEQKVIYFKEK